MNGTFVQFQNHIPVRGRKPVGEAVKPQGKPFQNHIPARGRKQACASSNVGQSGISKPYPRKGTETLDALTGSLGLHRISKPYPRKGTETPPQALVLFLKHENFKTISPQGDGNYRVLRGTCSSCSNFKTISPQGDGNGEHPSATTSYASFQNHIPARGRKRWRV